MEEMLDVFQKRKEVIDFLAQRLPEDQADEVRDLLADYFLGKADLAFEKIAEERSWDEKHYEEWAKDHWRSKH